VAARAAGDREGRHRGSRHRPRQRPRHVDAERRQGLSCQAIRTIFGDAAERLSITANKSLMGHTLGAAGAIEAVLTMQTIREGCVPPTDQSRRPRSRGAGLDLTPNRASAGRVRVASATRSASVARTRR
jgi:hypothetical protein